MLLHDSRHLSAETVLLHPAVTKLLLTWTLAAGAAWLAAWYFKSPGAQERLDRIAGQAVQKAWIAAVVYFLSVSALSLLRHFSLHTHGYDLGFFDQLVWRLSRFEGFHAIQEPGPALIGSLHFSPILYLLVPFYWVWPSPVVLLAAQTGLLALGGWFLLKIAHRELRSPLLVLAAGAAYFCFPYLLQANLFDFHEMAFGVPVFLGLVWMLSNRHYGWAAALAALYLSCREDAFIYLGGFSLVRLFVLGIRGHDGREMVFHACLILMAGLYGWAVLKFVMPGLLPNPATGAALNLSWFGHLGDSIGEILSTVVLQPGTMARLFFSEDRYLHLLRLLAAVGFAPFLSPGYFLIALLPIGVLLFSQHPFLIRFSHQYPLLFIPFFFVAYVYGLRTLERWLGESWRIPLAVFFIVLAVAGTRFRSLVPDLPSPHALAAGQFFRQVPARAALSAQSDLIPHLSQRMKLYHFPDVADAEYVVLDMKGNTWPLTRNDYEQRVGELWRISAFEKILDVDGFWLLVRRKH